MDRRRADLRAGCREARGLQARVPALRPVERKYSPARQTAAVPHACSIFEFEPLRWSYAGQRVREADVVLRLHVITATVATSEAGNRYRNKALERFDIIDALTQALLGFSYDDGLRQAGTMRAYESETDHDHGEVCEDIESWVTHCRDASGCDLPQPTTQPLRLGIGAPK